MAGLINAAATIAASERVVKTSAYPPTHDSGKTQPEANPWVDSSTEKTGASIEPKKAGGKNVAQLNDGPSGEIRRVVVEDGTLTINVYDRTGKLLRKTPPGYLPAGEEGFDVTV